MALLPRCINVQPDPVDSCCCPAWDLASAYMEGACVTLDGRTYYANCDIAAGTPFVIGTNGATWRDGSGGTTVIGPYNPCRTYAPNEAIVVDGGIWITPGGSAPGPFNPAEWEYQGGGCETFTVVEGSPNVHVTQVDDCTVSISVDESTFTGLESIIPGTPNVSIDATDPQNPIISVSEPAFNGIETITAGTPNVTVDATDPQNVIISVSEPSSLITSIEGGNLITIDDSDPSSPVVNFDLRVATVPETRAAAPVDNLLTAQLIAEASQIVAVDPAAPDWSAFWSGEFTASGEVEVYNPVNVQPGTVRHILVRNASECSYRLTFDSAYRGAFPESTCPCLTTERRLLLRLFAVTANDIVVEFIDAGATDNPFVLSQASLGLGRVGAAYSADISATGGAGSITYEFVGGELPDGVTFDPLTASLSGNPSEPGMFDFDISYTDAVGCVKVVNYRLFVADEVFSRFRGVDYSPELERLVYAYASNIDFVGVSDDHGMSVTQFAGPENTPVVGTSSWSGWGWVKWSSFHQRFFIFQQTTQNPGPVGIADSIDGITWSDYRDVLPNTNNFRFAAFAINDDTGEIFVAIWYGTSSSAPNSYAVYRSADAGQSFALDATWSGSGSIVTVNNFSMDYDPVSKLVIAYPWSTGANEKMYRDATGWHNFTSTGSFGPFSSDGEKAYSVRFILSNLHLSSSVDGTNWINEFSSNTLFSTRQMVYSEDMGLIVSPAWNATLDMQVEASDIAPIGYAMGNQIVLDKDAGIVIALVTDAGAPNSMFITFNGKEWEPL